MCRKTYLLQAREKTLELGTRTRMMGVVNITPDSFSDGGRFLSRQSAVERCLELAEAGAELLDLGGESTRPGAQPVSAAQELDRILPVLEEVRPQVPVVISVDTYKASVARRALEAGADMINDISAFRLDPEMPEVVSRAQAGAVLMHMRGTPQNMQKLPPSPDILGEIQTDLGVAVTKALESGISRNQLIIDPGIGFGKTADENCLILNRLSALKSFDLPVMVGPSRKSFLGKILDLPVQERTWGTAASVAFAIARGAHIVRIHDVGEMRQVARVSDALLGESTGA